MINSKLVKKHYDKRSACQVLGVLMKEPHRIKDKENNLNKQDFSTGLHETIFISIYNLANQGIKEIAISDIENYLAMSSPINYKRVFEDSNGLEWLNKILEDANPLNYKYYYQKVKKMSLLRSYLQQGIIISDILNIDEIDPIIKQRQQDEFDNMTINDIIKKCDKKILLAKKDFIIKDDGNSRKAGDNANELYLKMKESPSYGMGMESHYLNTIIRGMKKQDFFLETRDTGCVDCDTEYFNGYKWVKISKYKIGDRVLQYNLDGNASIVQPENYIKVKCDYLNHFKTKYGLDQCLCDEHNVVYINDRMKNNKKLMKVPFKEFKKKHEQLAHGHKGKFITTFNYEGKGINLTDEQIRVMIAVIADGSFVHEYKDRYLCRVNLKKERKKKRLEDILEKANIEYTKTNSSKKGYHIYLFRSPRIERHFNKFWYDCNNHQLKIVADEIFYWDGHIEQYEYYTTSKQSADFIQFVFTSLGKRTTIRTCDRRGRIRKLHFNKKEYVTKSVDYIVHVSSGRSLVSLINNQVKTSINKYKTKDGYKYCFTVPSGMLVLRRNNKIFVTGNCGKTRIALKRLLNLTAPYLWDFTKKDFIKNPNGFNNSALYIGTEMDVFKQLEPIMWAFISGVDTSKIKDNTLTKEEDERIKEAIKILQDTHLFLEDKPNFNVSYLWQIIEEYKVNHDIYAVGVDYIELNSGLIGEFTNSTKGMGVREDQILLNLSKNLKDIAKDTDTFVMAFTQTTDEARREGIRDQRAVKGARSLPNKADVGIVAFEPTKKELEKLEPVLKRRGLVTHKYPNICYSFYKNRDGEYNDIKIWGYHDLGTMEYQDLFCTDKDYKLININPTTIKVVDDVVNIKT